MMISKNLKTVLLTFAMFSSPIASMAQNFGPVNNPMGVVTQIQPGLYEQYQKTPVFQDMFRTLSNRNDKAAALYQESVRGFFTAFSDLQTYAHDKLIGPAINSITDENKEMSIKDYASNVQGYIEMKRDIELKIASIQDFPASLAARIETDAPGSGVNSVPTITAGLDFTKIATEFTSKIASVDAQIQKQQVVVKTKNRGVQTINLLDMSLIKVDFNKADLDAMSKEIKDARHMRDSDRDVISVYTTKLMEQINVVLHTYGNDERWRWNMHDQEYTARKQEQIQQLVDAFSDRSYIRMRYGVNLGMIGIKYDTKVFGLDRFFTNLNKITFQPVGLDSSYFAAREKEIAELVKTAGAKGQSMSNILKGDVSVMQSANSIVADIMGQKETAKALLPIVGLILNDMYEENLVLTGKRNELIYRYKARYYDTAKPNSKNPNGYSDREVALMRELEIDFNADRMTDFKNRGLIPETVTRVSGADPESLYGRSQDAIRTVKFKAVDYAKAESIQRTVDAYLSSLSDLSGQGDVDKALGL